MNITKDINDLSSRVAFSLPVDFLTLMNEWIVLGRNVRKLTQAKDIEAGESNRLVNELKVIYDELQKIV